MDVDAIIATLREPSVPRLSPTCRVFIAVDPGWYEDLGSGLEAWRRWRGDRPVTLATAVRGNPTVLELEVGGNAAATVVCAHAAGAAEELRIYVDPREAAS